MKRKHNIFVLILVALGFTLVCGYFITALLRTLIEKTKDVQGNVFDYKGTYDFLIHTTPENQLVILLLSGLVFTFIFIRINKKPKKFDYADQFGVHGTSRFGKFEEIINGIALSKNNKFKKNDPIKSLQVDNGLILGKVPDSNELLIMPNTTKIDNRNVLVVGSSGSGKGQSFVLPNIINNTDETMIVTDPKGELYHLTSQIKRDQGYKVYQIDFINFTEGGYNPLDYVEDDQDAQQIAKTIAKNSAKDGKEDFFQVEGQRLLTALIIYCKHEFENANIPDHVIRMFNQIADDEKFLPKLLDEMEPSHPAYQLLKSSTVAQGKTRASIYASFTQQTGIFTINKVANMTRKSTFNFKEFQEHKSILYVKIPMDENPFLSLTATFFDQLISVFYRYADRNYSKLKIPTIFELDEFANIGKIEKYGRVLATCRGLGMSLNTIVQDIGQLESLYGKEMARSIISNHDTQVFLRTKDNETAQYFSKLAGETTARMDTQSSSVQGGIFSTRYSTSRSNQEQFVKRALITEGELINIDPNDSYVFIAGYYPFKTQKAWQFEMYGDLLENYEKYREKLIKKNKNFVGEVRTNEESSEVVNSSVEINKHQIEIENEHEPFEVENLVSHSEKIEKENDNEGNKNIINDELIAEEQDNHLKQIMEREAENETANTLNDEFLTNEQQDSEREETDSEILDRLLENPAYLEHKQIADESMEKMEESAFVIRNIDSFVAKFEEEFFSNDSEQDTTLPMG